MHLRETGLILSSMVMLLSMSACGKKFSIAGPRPPASINHSTYSKQEYDADLKTYASLKADDANKAQKDQLRNKIVYRLMSDIDYVYGDYTARIYTGKGALAVTGDSVTLGLTAATTIATHAPTKTIFGALATALTGVNLSLDKNFFAQQTFAALGLAMQNRRDKVRASIVSGLVKSSDVYPLEAATRDLISYFYAGTLPGGLQEIQEEMGSNSPKAPAETPH